MRAGGRVRERERDTVPGRRCGDGGDRRGHAITDDDVGGGGGGERGGGEGSGDGRLLRQTMITTLFERQSSATPTRPGTVHAAAAAATERAGTGGAGGAGTGRACVCRRAGLSVPAGGVVHEEMDGWMQRVDG